MLKTVASTIRGLAADMVEEAASGHPGLPLGCAEVGALLFGEILKIDPQKPHWLDRDRFVLSAGHGSALLYSLLHLAGFPLPLTHLKKFRQLGSKTPGHPEYGITPGVETTTGPLGQGMANAVGMALTERILASRYNTPEHTIVDHHTYTLLSDGCIMEGVVAEAASLAGHLGLGKLIAIYDDNNISIEGKVDLSCSDDTAQRFQAYGWQVFSDIDGHNIEALQEAIQEGKNEENKPTLIIAKTRIARGAPNLEGSSKSHGAPLGTEEIRKLKENMGFPPDQLFYVPPAVQDFFAQRKDQLVHTRKAWEEEFTAWGKANPALLDKWQQAHDRTLPENLLDITRTEPLKEGLSTREASGVILNNLAQEIEELMGGSADLAPSNKSYLEGYPDMEKGNYQGRNIRFGIREHAMGAICNGMALHGGVRPYCATFLVFSDYMRPAIRLAALMEQPVIYLFTHDSIFVGEDGPTHQPVEQLESLRLIPNLKVLRPADGEETREAWIEALQNREGPTALILSRQGLPWIMEGKSRKGFQQGAYRVKGEGKAAVSILASGSEVSLAVDTAESLEKEGISAQVISVPNREAFSQQQKEYQDELLGRGLRVVIEAGRGGGWYRFLGPDDLLISIEGFGASAPYSDLQRQFQLEAPNIVEKIRLALQKEE